MSPSPDGTGRPGLARLIARPFAHRGLHDAARGIVENTATAAMAAIEGGFGVECDVRLTACGEAIVFHDATLERLMDAHGPVEAQRLADLRRTAFRASGDRVITLGELCDLVAGRQALLVEVKASWSRDRRLEARVARILRGYRGAVAAMSFDPASALTLRRLMPGALVGVVAERRYDHPDWRFLSPARTRRLAALADALAAQPDFVAWNVRDLPDPRLTLLRRRLGLAVLTWTVRSAQDHRRAREGADQIIFEGFIP